MCTVILFFRVVPSHPIVLAGNRDEFFDRESCHPHLWDIPGNERPMRIFAGRDMRAGGTWFGINEEGVLAGVTNYFSGSRDPAKRSRGELILKCLSHDSPADALACLREEDADSYNPFNLFCLSRESLFFFTNFPAPRIRHPMKPGIYILTNQSFDDAQDTKRIRILDWLAEPASHEGALEARIRQILQYHDEPAGTDPVCVHLPAYGTVSSSIVFIGRSWDRSRFLHAEGPPCKHHYMDRTEMFRELFQKKIT